MQSATFFLLERWTGLRLCPPYYAVATVSGGAVTERGDVYRMVSAAHFAKAWQRCCSSRPFVLVQHFCFRTDDGACEQSVQRRSSPTRTAELVLERELTRNRRGYVQVGRFAGSQWSVSRPTQTKGDKQVTIFRVVLLQAGSCGPDLGASRENGISLCKRARESGADLCLFPEMWSIGYAIGDQDFDWDAAAIDVGDPYVGEFRDLASRLQMAIALTFLERTPDGFRNSCALIDRRGEVVLVYAKVHTVAFSCEGYCTPGEDFYVAPLDIGRDVIQVGIMICYDREFPESARILALKGAEVILTPNACNLEPSRLGQFRTRAFENNVAMVMVNYPHVRMSGSWPEAGDGNMNGRSVVYSPIAFDPPVSGGAPIDPLLLDAGEVEGIYTADIDVTAIRTYRKTSIWGAAYRRPSRYHMLAEKGTGSTVEA